MLDEELRCNDPDLADRCGLLDDRFEVFAALIPQCGQVRLALSVDIAQGSARAVMLHGAVPARTACARARRLATEHRRLRDPFWE